MKNTDFEHSNIQKKVIAPKLVIRFSTNDKTCLRMPINEFAYNLYKTDQSFNSKENVLYWLSFCFYLDSKYKKNKKDFTCSLRPNKYIDSKYYSDYTFLLWNIIKKHKKLKENLIMKEIINNAFIMYCMNFKKGTRIKKRMYIVFAVNILLDIPRINYKSYTHLSYYSDIITFQLDTNTIYMNVYDQYRQYLHKKELNKANNIKLKYKSSTDKHYNEFIKEELYLNY